MRILVVATKPPWPPHDGGRLALWLTLQGLADAGHAIDLIAPAFAKPDRAALTALQRICTPHIVSITQQSWHAAAANALRHRCALSVARHHHPEIERAVARCISILRPDVVHAEQLQAWSNCAAARTAGIPVLLRMQNVESSLWEQTARTSFGLRPLRFEAHRLLRDEQRALHAAARVVALTKRDATALRRIAGDADCKRIVTVAPPFPSALNPGAAMAGAPAIALAGSTGWWPNRSGVRWFVDRVVPALLAAQPSARIHIYGGSRVQQAGVVWHEAPDDAADAFPTDAIAAIPLHIGSGIRMRILEAWARGLPVVATSIAAAGLEVASGRELLLADTPTEFVQAIRRLSAEPALRGVLVAAGRGYLAKHHEPSALTDALVTQYRIATT